MLNMDVQVVEYPLPYIPPSYLVPLSSFHIFSRCQRPQFSSCRIQFTYWKEVHAHSLAIALHTLLHMVYLYCASMLVGHAANASIPWPIAILLEWDTLCMSSSDILDIYLYSTAAISSSRRDDDHCSSQLDSTAIPFLNTTKENNGKAIIHIDAPSDIVKSSINSLILVLYGPHKDCVQPNMSLTATYQGKPNLFNVSSIIQDDSAANVSSIHPPDHTHLIILLSVFGTLFGLALIGYFMKRYRTRLKARRAQKRKLEAALNRASVSIQIGEDGTVQVGKRFSQYTHFDLSSQKTSNMESTDSATPNMAVSNYHSIPIHFVNADTVHSSPTRQERPSLLDKLLSYLPMKRTSESSSSLQTNHDLLVQSRKKPFLDVLPSIQEVRESVEGRHSHDTVSNGGPVSNA